MSNGLMDRGPAVSGKKVLIFTIGGLVLFTVVMLIVTLGIGNVFGKVLDKKAMDHEKTIETQMMRDKEAGQKH